MDHKDNAPSEDAVRALLAVIAADSALVSIRPLAGSHSNFSHLVEIDSAFNVRARVVIRRYAGSESRGRKKAQVEFNTLAWLRQHDVPVPEPLYLDETGALLGSPGIVTRYVPGKQILSPSNAQSWARGLAKMLANIHSISCGDDAQRFLLDGNAEVVWFLRSGAVPEYMQAHPDGTGVWHAVRELSATLNPVPPTLLHIDYWPGNILWNGDQIVAVVDWEEAAYGDPGIDVAYCRMELLLSGMEEAADEFLRTYETEMGEPVADLGLWGLAATARPMYAPTSWRINEPQISRRFRQFIADAKRRVE